MSWLIHMKAATVSATKYKHLWAVYKLILKNTDFKNITTSVSGDIEGLEIHGISQANKKHSSKG